MNTTFFKKLRRVRRQGERKGFSRAEAF